MYIPNKIVLAAVTCASLSTLFAGFGANGAEPQMMHAQVTRNAQNQSRFMQRNPGEVLRRDARINQRINNNYGHLSGQYGNLERQDFAIQRQTMNDMRKNGGYLSNSQDKQLNREENNLNRETFFDNTNNRFVQNHPRRSEVLGRDARLGYAINKDEGHLGGQYGQLIHEDRQIAHQEQTDARNNGGFITRQQQQQLNQEETQLRNQIQQDYTH